MLKTVLLRTHSLGRWWMFLVAFLLGLLIQDMVLAQTKHHLVHGNMPPGLVGERALMTHPNWIGQQQSVKVQVPQGSAVSYLEGQGFVDLGYHEAVFGMQLGSVYRFKVSNIRRYPGYELFPSVELVSKLHPPEGLESDFPVPVLITQDDLEQALQGKMVTKVIYLEDPETALPFRQGDGEMANMDISGYEDALHTAERLGRPMAILRMGSRQPLATDTAGGTFQFNSPQIKLLPQSFEGGTMPQVIPEVIPESNTMFDRNIGFPPIIDGSRKASYTIGDK